MSKRYPHIISKLFYEPLIITAQHHAAMCQVLEKKMANGMPDMPMDHDEPDEDDLEPDWETMGADAVIPVHGVLVGHASDIPMSSCGCGCDMVSTMIDLAMDDPDVEKLIFDFRSPGGAVTGVPEIASKIANIRDKKTIAFTDDECCSGALWMAAQCQYFYCTGSANIGSVGVWCAYLDMSRQMQNEGVQMQAISAGKFKLMGAFWKPLSDEERGMLQADVDRIYGQFKNAMGMQRPISDEFMQGQVFDGEKAVAIGICDGLVDSLDDLLEGETDGT